MDVFMHVFHQDQGKVEDVMDIFWKERNYNFMLRKFNLKNDHIYINLITVFM